jgi:hypothetical protein
MIKNFTKFRIAKHFLLLNAIFLLLSFCIVGISFAAEEFPWEIFYPAIIKKSIDHDKDGFTKEQGDCNDSDSSINPDATEICGDGIDQDCDGSDLPCLTCADITGNWIGNYTEHHCSGVTVHDNFSMVIRNDCSFTFIFSFAQPSGTWTISNYTISSTIPDPGTGQCGLYTNTATVNGNEMSGTISSTKGSSGTFYFKKTD